MENNNLNFSVSIDKKNWESPQLQIIEKNMILVGLVTLPEGVQTRGAGYHNFTSRGGDPS